MRSLNLIARINQDLRTHSRYSVDGALRSAKTPYLSRVCVSPVNEKIALPLKSRAAAISIKLRQELILDACYSGHLRSPLHNPWP